jgi:hypothetical protein
VSTLRHCSGTYNWMRWGRFWSASSGWSLLGDAEGEEQRRSQ